MWQKKLLVAALAGLVGWAGDADADPSISLVFRGTGDSSSVTLNPGETAVLDVLLINDTNLATAWASVAMQVTNVVEVTGAARLVLVTLPWTADPDGPIGFFSTAYAVTPPGTYNLGNITYQAVASGMVTLRTRFTPGLDDWCRSSDLLGHPERSSWRGFCSRLRLGRIV
jgi:hypothetical protein